MVLNLPLRESSLRRTISAEVKRQMIEQYRQGVNLHQLSRQFGFARASIRRVLLKAGLTIEQITRPHKLNDQQKDDVAKAYENGESAQSISEHYGISSSTVHRILREVRQGEVNQ